MIKKAITPLLILLVAVLSFSLVCELRFGLGNFGSCLSSPIAMLFGRDSGSTRSARAPAAVPVISTTAGHSTVNNHSAAKSDRCYQPCAPARPQARTASVQRPACLKWHRVRRGETQWKLARHYAGRGDKWHWIKAMRWVSRKSAGDSVLKAGESVCVNWRRAV